MKNMLLTLVLGLTLSACAHNQKDEFNMVSHEALGEDFVAQKNEVCNHFRKTSEELVFPKVYSSSYLEEDEVVQKKVVFVVEKKHVPAWRCGRTAWKINQNLQKEVALGIERFVE